MLSLLYSFRSAAFMSLHLFLIGFSVEPISFPAEVASKPKEFKETLSENSNGTVLESVTATFNVLPIPDAAFLALDNAVFSLLYCFRSSGFISLSRFLEGLPELVSTLSVDDASNELKEEDVGSCALLSAGAGVTGVAGAGVGSSIGTVDEGVADCALLALASVEVDAASEKFRN